MNSSSSFQDQNSIEYIRKKLWCGQEFGQVAVMIGSGFSRNAEKISQDTPPFPLWKDLCDTILRATHSQGSLSKTDYDIKIKQLLGKKESPTIAQEFQDLFGPSALDELLIRTIPDLHYLSGPLHTLMLTLPWSDVFTTNYDTLLERTLPTVYEKKYDVVSTVYDIPQKMKPRIVKLHGSFPSHRPFIISKKEYDEYPKKFAPFTNIVRQSIMENTFCLIGFSSDDPNFLQWTEWVYKNLGDYKPNIYLCGVLDLTDEKRSDLLGKRITPIDFGPLFPKSEWIDPDLRHKNALEWFALNLMYGAPPNPMRWPAPSEKTHWKASNQLIPDIPPGPPRLPEMGSFIPELYDDLPIAKLEEVCQKWKNQRDYYPGWIIAPYDNRKQLIEYTLRWVDLSLKTIKNVPAPQNIVLLYELNWRIETSLSPVFSNWAKVYEQIVLSYNPYPKLVKNKNSIYSPEKEECKKFDWNTIGKSWVQLIFSLIREDRWDQKNEKFQFWIKLLEPVVKLNGDWYLQWYYEKCLYSLSRFDQKNLRLLLKKWPKTQYLPFFEVKRAALLAELGELHEAKEITEKALSNIRSKHHTNPNNYLFLSQEGWAMLLLQSIQSEELYQSQNFLEASSVRSQFRDRWDRLDTSNCNPWQEIEKLQFILKNNPPSELPVCTTNMGFDPGKSTETYHLPSSSTLIDVFPAFAFVRIFEEVGLPVNCGHMSMFHEALLNASKWIEPYSSPWATSLMIRTGKEKEVGELFNRSRIVLMTDDQINSHFDLFINSLKQSLEYVGNCDVQFGKEESFSNLQIKITTELLSRLAFRLSKKQIDELLDITNQLYLRNLKSQNISFNDSLNHLFERIFYSMSDSEIIKKLPNLLNLPILILLEGQHPGMDHLVDPFSYIEWNQDTIIPEQLRLSLTPNIIQLLKMVENCQTNERVRTIQRLLKLYEIKGLSSIEEKRFGKALWSRCDPATGLPTDTGLLNASFLYLPESKSGVAYQKLKLYLTSIDIPKIFTSTISADGKPAISVSSGSDFIGYVHDWGMATYVVNPNEDKKIEKSIDWSPDDAFNLLLKIKKMWDENKAAIIKYKDNTGIFGFFKSNIDNEIWGIRELLRVVILPRFSKIERPEAKQIIKQLFDEMESNNICMNSLIALQISIEPEKYDELSSKLRKGLISLNLDDTRDSINGLFNWIVFAEQKIVKSPTPDFISEIINQIMNRRQPNLKINLSMITNLLNRYPNFLSPEQINSLCLALEYLLIETDIKSSHGLEQSSHLSTAISISSKPEYRHISTRLAFALFNYFNRNQMIIPDIILKWKDLSHADSLPEVRREWNSL
jgi:hypothetical protein